MVVPTTQTALKLAYGRASNSVNIESIAVGTFPATKDGKILILRNISRRIVYVT